MRSIGRVKFSADEFELREGDVFVLDMELRGPSCRPPKSILSAGDRSNVERDIDALLVQLWETFSGGVVEGGVEWRGIVKENS